MKKRIFSVSSLGNVRELKSFPRGFKPCCFSCPAQGIPQGNLCFCLGFLGIQGLSDKQFQQLLRQMDARMMLAQATFEIEACRGALQALVVLRGMHSAFQADITCQGGGFVPAVKNQAAAEGAKALNEFFSQLNKMPALHKQGFFRRIRGFLLWGLRDKRA